MSPSRSFDTDRSRWQRDLSVAYIKIGDVLVAQGDLTGALESYRASHAIFERLSCLIAHKISRWANAFVRPDCDYAFGGIERGSDLAEGLEALVGIVLETPRDESVQVGG